MRVDRRSPGRRRYHRRLMQTLGARAQEGDTPARDRRLDAPLPLIVRVGLGVAVAIGVVVRFVGPGAMWLDEALTMNIARRPLGDIGTLLVRDGHPPLFYWLLHGWMDLFGTSDTAVRSLSGVMSVATLPLAWWAGKRAGGRAAGAWALLIVALSPFAVHYATEARMYSLVMCLVLAGVLAVYACLEQPKPLRLVGLALVAGALLWAHYWSIYLVGVTGAYLLLIALCRPAHRRAALASAAATAIGSATFVLWLPSFLDQLDKTGTPWSVRTGPTNVLSRTVTELGGGGWPSSLLLGMLTLALVLVALFGRIDDDGTAVQLTGHLRPSAAPVLGIAAATLLVGTAVQQASGTAYESRYASVLVPLIWIGAAVGATQVPKVWPRAAIVVLVVALSLAGIGQDIRLDRSTAGFAADVIAAGVGPDDVVVACPDQLGVGIDRALRQRGVSTPVLAYPALGNPRFIDWRDYAARNAAANPVAFADAVNQRAGDGAIWFYNSDEYLTIEHACDVAIDRLAQLRPKLASIASPDALFERGDLVHFGAPSGP